VSARIAGQPVEANIEVLVWSDIVRGSMSQTIPATYLQLVRTAWIYIGSGALRRLMLLRKGPVIAALYPVGMLLVQALVAVLTAYGVFAVIGMLLGPLLGLVATIGGALPGILAGVAVLRWFKARDARFYAYYTKPRERRLTWGIPVGLKV